MAREQQGARCGDAPNHSPRAFRKYCRMAGVTRSVHDGKQRLATEACGGWGTRDFKYRGHQIDQPCQSRELLSGGEPTWGPDQQRNAEERLTHVEPVIEVAIFPELFESFALAL